MPFREGNKTEIRDSECFSFRLLMEDASKLEGTRLYQVTHEYTPVVP